MKKKKQKLSLTVKKEQLIKEIESMNKIISQQKNP